MGLTIWTVLLLLPLTLSSRLRTGFLSCLIPIYFKTTFLVPSYSKIGPCFTLFHGTWSLASEPHLEVRIQEHARKAPCCCLPAFSWCLPRVPTARFAWGLRDLLLSPIRLLRWQTPVTLLTTGSHEAQDCAQMPSFGSCISCNSVGLQVPVPFQYMCVSNSSTSFPWFSNYWMT